MSSSQVNPQVRQHPEVWYFDGNVLLIAETTSFRVHKSILARHSEFFHDMFNLPQPPTGAGGTEVGQDDVPVVHTSESAEDLAHFLGAIYNSIMYFRHDTTLPYAAVRAILRLAQKFSSEPLRTLAVGRLQAAFPRRFADWEAIAQSTAPAPLDYADTDLVGIANLAQELELVDLLPVVLYECCQLSLDWILGGVPQRRAGEEVAVSAAVEGEGVVEGEGAVDTEGAAANEGEEDGEVERIYLSRENQKAVLTARSRLTLATVQMLAGLGYVRDGLCDQYACTAALREVSMGTLVKGDAVFDPLTALNRELAAEPVAQPQPGLFGQIGPPPIQQGIDILCRACRESCRNHLRISREKILKDIESYIPVDYMRVAGSANGSQG